MADKDFDQPENGDEVLGGEGSEAHVSDPDPQGDPSAGSGTGAEELTVDDILGTTQNPDAAAEDATQQPGSFGAEDAVDAAADDLFIDLKRLQAEYANYRRRTEEQREIEIERAKGAVAKGLLPVLDDLDRAEKHGDLDEGTPFAAIAEKLRGVAERMGLATYGEAGEAFDPQQHEAIFQAPTPGVTQAAILEVVEVGYRLGSVELRPAKVVVAVPADPSTGSGTGSTGSGTGSTGSGTG